MENGLPLLIENLPEEIDPVLDAVIQKKARGRLCRGVVRQGSRVTWDAAGSERRTQPAAHKPWLHPPPSSPHCPLARRCPSAVAR